MFYSGYWIKTYKVPENTLVAKKRLIEALTRRLFDHTEHGLNIPGCRLSDARQSAQAEIDPARRRATGHAGPVRCLTELLTSSKVVEFQSYRDCRYWRYLDA